MNVLVLLGGESPEREVSQRSGVCVAAALEEAGYDVMTYDPMEGDDGLASAVAQADIVLPILHGVNGEDGVIQKKLEVLDKPYLGSDSGASAKAFDKQQTHAVLAEHGIQMPRHWVVNNQQLMQNELITRGAPFVLKPINGGSSVDTLISRQPDHVQLDEAKKLLNHYGDMMLEELIEGLEVTVPILGAIALPVIAIIPPEDGEFDYENKYNGKTQEICPVPGDMLSLEKQKRLQDLALRVHGSLQARHLSRVDMIIQPDGTVYVLELNALPGMTDQSLFPKAAAVHGLSMIELVKEFVSMARSA